MKMQRVVSFAIVLCLVAAAALAADVDQEKRRGPSISEWLKGLQQKMAFILPKKSISLSTGVAGVRGAKEDSQVKLYWKGKKGDEAVSEEEMIEFRSGIELASAGDNKAAIKELEEFMAQFPDSPLIPDVKKTLDLVRLEPETKPAPEVKKAEPQTQETTPAPAAQEQKVETPAPAAPAAKP